MRDLSYEEAVREQVGEDGMERARQFADAAGAAVALIDEATKAFEYLPIWVEEMISGFRAAAEQVERAREMREQWQRNPRNRYQPYMFNSRRPRYQPKYPN